MLVFLSGALGIGANCVIYQQNSGKKLLLWKLISDLVWFVHYLLLNAYSGAAVAFIAVCREFVFYKENKKGRKNIFWLLFFICISAISAALTWKNIMSIFPALASMISIVGFWKANPVVSRVLAFPVSGLMLTYDLCCDSYVGMINEITTIIATLIMMGRIVHKGNAKKGE